MQLVINYNIIIRGSNLDDKEIIVPEIEGLFKGKAKYDEILENYP